MNNLFQLRRAGPIVVDFPAHRAIGAHGPVDVDHELRVMVIYPPQAIVPSEMRYLKCECPRVAKADGLVVWHSPECEELDA